LQRGRSVSRSLLNQEAFRLEKDSEVGYAFFVWLVPEALIGNLLVLYLLTAAITSYIVQCKRQ
jgi:hypothetical protein